jgi:SAM-dependent methyltransferase
MKITDEELAAMPPKSVRFDAEVKLYKENDFITAYGKHTDKRIAETGYQAAIGGGTNWDFHGELQRDFLIAQGLKPHHALLDIGCGTGRLARKAAPRCQYWGYDISAGAVDAANALSHEEGWDKFRPTISLNWPNGALFNFIWAFSVFIHLPREECVKLMTLVGAVMAPAARFYFSYVPEDRDWRSGLKQFRHTLKTYQACAAEAGLTFEDVPNWIESTGRKPSRETGNQRIALATLK